MKLSAKLSAIVGLLLTYPSELMSLSYLGTFRVTSRIALVIARGSVLGFASKKDSAIVNAANEGCLGGGGVDGAISDAGGEALFKARMALPLIKGVKGDFVRCPTGEAKITGPDEFGEIMTNHVIHAVGPHYNEFEEGEYDAADSLLKSAYRSSLEVAREAKLSEVGFSLLSAGVYKGQRSLKQVLTLGVESICEWAKEQPETCSIELVVMCAFSEREADTLMKIAQELELEEEKDNENPN